MDPFEQKIADATTLDVIVIALAGDSNAMQRFHRWALEQRAGGVHMAIFLKNNRLEVPTPARHFAVNPPVLWE